jgi:hypothetical protein
VQVRHPGREKWDPSFSNHASAEQAELLVDVEREPPRRDETVCEAERKEGDDHEGVEPPPSRLTRIWTHSAEGLDVNHVHALAKREHLRARTDVSSLEIPMMGRCGMGDPRFLSSYTDYRIGEDMLSSRLRTRPSRQPCGNASPAPVRRSVLVNVRRTAHGMRSA